MQSPALLGLLCFIVIICAANSRKFKRPWEVQNSYDRAQQFERQHRKDAHNKLGKADKRIQGRNRGVRELKMQVRGNVYNDFVDIENAQVDSFAITNITGTARLSEADFAMEGCGSGRRSHRAVRQVDGRSEVKISGRPIEAVSQEDERVTKRKCIFDRANSAPCNPKSRFQTPSGHCNNLIHKTWGMAGTAFSRKLAPTYQDGIQAVRTTTHVSNKPLPNPRKISTIVTNTRVVLDDLGFSNYLMQWGQFQSHEVTSIAETERGAICCVKALAKEQFDTESPTKAQVKEARTLIKRLRDDVCIAIEIEDDTVNGEMCMSQVRAATVPNEDCTPSPRLQMNTASHIIDGSAIYGSSTKTLKSLRGPRGKLKVQIIDGEELPPKANESCSTKCPFSAGDFRINTTPNLIVTHTLFIKKHNQLVGGLKVRNPHWKAERLFQEARKIIIAIEQNIHSEWLQVLLGDDILTKRDLKPFKGTGFRDTYNPDINLSLLAELSVAAQRFGHATVGGLFPCKGRHNLVDNFDKPDIIYDDGIDECLVGLSQFPPWKADEFFVDAMRDKMFGAKLDIVSLNINRGRDFALDSYASYRKAYGFPVIKEWKDLRATHTKKVIRLLKKVYPVVGDVELYIGGVTEKKLPDGFIGPLFAEILGEGYMKLRNGDRFYFESKTAGFTPGQVGTLRSYKFSNLVCDVGGVVSIPSDIFRRKSRKNPDLVCADSTTLDLSQWAEDGSTPTCKWMQTDTSKCCKGKKTITRKCVGGDNCKAGDKGCKGGKTVEENCGEDHPSCSSKSCKWVTKRQSKCCDGELTVTRKCGGRGCKPGSEGCEGEERTTKPCKVNADSCPSRCKWQPVSSTGCCDGKDTIQRKCAGGNSCKPGSPGCPGSTTITEICQCPKRNSRCGHDCPVEDECQWKVVSRSPCCNKEKTIKKKCIGGPHCVAGSGGCSGRASIKRKCEPTCSADNPRCRSDEKCSSSSGSCKWKTIRTSKCRRGKQTVRRRCVGGKNCKTGVSGCPGKRALRKKCSTNQ